MGIINLHIEKIDELLTLNFPLEVEKSVAILGYPDLHQNRELLEKLYETKVLKNSIKDGIYHLIDILRLKYNCKSTVFDIARHRGIEEIINFNNPLPEQYKNQFDFLIDSSCLEHCFNITQAFQNMCDFVKVGGIVTTVAPVYDFNHGYFNLNPIFYEDGFSVNGFEILSQNVVNNSGDIYPDFGAKTHPRKTYILTTAKKVLDVPFTHPIQSHKGKDRKYDKR
jgi:SAM-dependent methyltransferase